MISSRRAIAILFAWLGALSLLAAVVQHHLVVSNDLRSFMPPAQTADQRLLLDEIGEGPASRLLMLSIDSGSSEKSAALSEGLAHALRDDKHFDRVLNGETDLSILDDKLLAYRYLLSSTLDENTFDAAYLGDQLQQRVEDLGSPAASLLKPLLARDPTGEVLKLAQQWTPAFAPQLRAGVWMNDHNTALLLVQTRAAAFDPNAQGEAIAAVESAYRLLPDAQAGTLKFSGPGYFSVLVSASTRAEAERLSVIGTAAFALLILLAYRRFRVLGLIALPILSGALAGVAATSLMFGPVHGITLAFGFTLLGVAQEYPIRLLSHRQAGQSVDATVRSVWPLLRLAIISACIAYLAFFASGVAGLQQLAVFTIAGLLVAGAATRWLLPALLPATFRDVATLPWLESLRIRLDALVHPTWIAWALLCMAGAMLWFAPGPFWQDDLASLTPVPAALLQREGELRSALGAPDVRYLLVLEAASADAVLALSEKISVTTQRWIDGHAVDDVELPSRYLPSLATQRVRQQKLPERASLEAALVQAQTNGAFTPGLFKPFVDDVQSARMLPLLTPAAFSQSALGGRLQAMLSERDRHWVALATLSGVHDAQTLEKIASATQGQVHLLDLKGASESLVASYRARIGKALIAALLLLAATVALAFRDVRRAWHVIAPMSLATLWVLAVLRFSGVSLSLFHLVALTLAAGLGLHYALFFERAVDTDAEARRTLHATIICVVSALLVFGLLASSSVPVLRAIGLTVALGVGFHFCLSILMARGSQSRAPRSRDANAHVA